MQVSDYMLKTVYTIHADATLGEAIQIMAHHMIDTLPVVDEERSLLGVVLLDDVLTQFMPNFVQIVRSADFVRDLGDLKTGRDIPRVAEKPCAEIMREPYYVNPDSSLMLAIVRMHTQQAPGVPVVDEENRLVGLMSYARAGSLFLREWLERSDHDDVSSRSDS